MILYTLDTKKRMRKNGIVFGCVGAFCILFSTIYNMYGHGVESIYMNYMFIWPLIAMILYIICGIRRALVSRICSNLFNAGIATISIGFMLRGIFEIAGTSSVFQKYYILVGGIFLLLSGVTLVIENLKSY